MAENVITAITPEIWSQIIFQILHEKALTPSLLAKVYDGEAKRAKKVHIPSPTAVTVGTYTPGSDISIQNVTPTTQTLEIDQYNYWALAEDDVEKLFARPGIRQMYVPQALADLAEFIDAAVLAWLYGGASLQVDASDGYTGGAGDDGMILVAGTPANAGEITPSQALARAKRYMDDLKIPRDGRVAVLSARFMEILNQSKVIVEHANAAFATAALVEGKVTRLHGFKLAESSLLALAAAKRHCLAFHPTCGAFVGVHEKFEVHRRELRFGDLIKGLYVWGRKMLDGNRCVDMIVAEA